MPNLLRGIIDREEGDFIIIKVAGDQDLYWPKKQISFHYNEGEAVNIYLSKDELETEMSEAKAKTILRQIFQPNA
jgi:bifunctional DNA-binding transcriptional regulator/antitoxin component of YhaV-PrlF toxin-antitoxin module